MVDSIDSGPVGGVHSERSGGDSDLTYEQRVARLVSRSEADLRARLESGVAEICRAVQELNRWIVALDRLLWRLQPPTTGRIRVLWREREGGGASPVLVKWKQVRNGWHTEKLGPHPSKSVEKWGGFGTHLAEVRKVVKLTRSLIERRAALLERATALRLSGEERALGVDAASRIWRVEVESILSEANEKMDAYEMDAYVEPLSLSWVMDGEGSA